MFAADATQPAPPAADVLLVTVTEGETRAVFAALRDTAQRGETAHHLAGHVSYDLGVIGDARVWLVRSEMGTATPGGALPTIASAIAVLQPAAIIAVGIAFGMDPTGQRLGDVLVATQLMLYDHQRLSTTPDGALQRIPRGVRTAASPVLLDRCRHGAMDWPPTDAAGAQCPTVHFGLLLSGDKLVDYRGFRDELRQIEREAIGGEMEGAGLYLAASATKVDWIVVKAICDWADGHKARNKRARLQQAAANAAAFTFHVLTQGGFAAPTPRPTEADAARILQRLQALLGPTPAPYRATVTRMVEDYAAIFGGRNAELDVLDRWLVEDTRPFAFLHAPTGRGKTALLIHWVARVQERGDWTVVFVPISLRYQTATEISVLGALGAALAAFHHDNDFTTYNQAPDQLRSLVADYLRRAPPQGQRLLLVLDGLDEAIGWRVGRELFPRTLGPYLRVVASAREKAGTTRAQWSMQLGWAPRQTCDLGLEGLSQAAVSDVLARMGNPLDALATDVDLLAEIARVSGGDPLTIRFLVEALQDGTLTPGRLVGLTEGLAAYVTDWLDELRTHSAETHTVYAVLSLCAVALEPLTIEDCMALDAAHFARGVDVQRAAAAVDRFLMGDGSVERGYVFSHPRLRELFLERVLTARERRNVQARFVAYGHAWYARRTPLPDYVRLFWVRHLSDAGDWAQVREVLTEVVPSGPAWVQPWATARYAAEGSYTGYLSDLDVLWTQREQQNSVATALHCALIASTLRSLSGNLPPALLVALVTVGTPQGRWSVQAALETITHMPDPEQRHAALMVMLAARIVVPPTAITVMQAAPEAWERAEVLVALAPHLPQAVLRVVQAAPDMWERAEVLVALAPHLPEAVLRVVQAAPDTWERAEVLSALAPHLPAEVQPAVLTQALTAAQVVPDAGGRAVMLSALMPHLPQEAQPAVLTQALTAAQAAPEAWERGKVLVALAPHLPQAVLTAVQAAPDTWERVKVLSALAPHLPQAVLTAVQAMSEAWERAQVLVALAPHLPACAQAAVLAQVLSAAQAEPDAGRRAGLLTALAPHLPDAVLPVAQAEPDAGERAQVLSALVPHLPQEAQAAVVAQALTAAQAEPDASRRAVMLVTLVPHLPTEMQAAVLTQALTAVQAAPDTWERAQVLVALALHLPQAVLTAVQAAPDTWERAQVLVALAPHLPQAVLTAVQAAPDTWERGKVLVALAPHLPQAVLTAVQAAPDTWERVKVLSALAPHLPEAVLRVVQAAPDAGGRAQVLVALAPHLPLNAQATVYAQALTAAQAMSDARERAEVLTALAPRLAHHATRADFLRTLRILASRGRPDLLRDLAALLPWIVAITTETERAEIAQAVIDVGRCWP